MGDGTYLFYLDVEVVSADLYDKFSREVKNEFPMEVIVKDKGKEGVVVHYEINHPILRSWRMKKDIENTVKDQITEALKLHSDLLLNSMYPLVSTSTLRLECLWIPEVYEGWEYGEVEEENWFTIEGIKDAILQQ